VVFAFDVDLIRISSTPLQLLVVVLVLTALVLAFMFAMTTILAPLVDRRWPADEPINATEMLWGEAGGYVERTFRGLDLASSKDLASNFVERKVKAGEVVIEQGDPSTHFYVVKDGSFEVGQRIEVGGMVRQETIRRYGAGDSFGELGILRRIPRTATVRALTEGTVLELTAEDFVVGTVLSAADDNVLLDRVDQYLAEDRRRARVDAPAGMSFLDGGGADEPPVAAPAPVAVAAPEADPEPAPIPAAVVDPIPEPAPEPAPAPVAAAAPAVPPPPSPFGSPTHRVPVGGLPTWDQPGSGLPPTTRLAEGLPVLVVERRDAWTLVRAENGWQGWVDGRALVPLDR